MNRKKKTELELKVDKEYHDTLICSHCNVGRNFAITKNGDVECGYCGHKKANILEEKYNFPKSKDVVRRDDMSQTGKLRLHLQDDADIGISIFKNDNDHGLGDGWVSLEFCDIGAGGGRSVKTLNALRNLMVAIEHDNEQRPIVI